jgi:hypothetical protein
MPYPFEELQMIEGTKRLNGATITGVELQTGEDVLGNYEGEHKAYRLEIKTSLGVLVFEGCHDATGDLEINGYDVGIMIR